MDFQPCRPPFPHGVDAAGLTHRRALRHFVADALFDGRRLRTLTIVDNYTREHLAIEVEGSLRGLNSTLKFEEDRLFVRTAASP
ncbi:hypothetical protein [Burkholderia lata]|uniref:hypothetical protein n=1 Tax=Burkholderia lata (strain ATCC 17760 / DSM 23089 / LMG 22485 / NCIMB 9086 / R18194 / 383) TaxID=482957 RepID=UPI00158315A9|nr:hypothetical protein [Burkholderia lata]